MEKEKLLLVDGHSILSRAFYGIPELTNSQGIHTNAVYGFLNILFKVMDEENADHLAVAFDMHAPTFRHALFSAYKGTRKPMPEELREQVPLMQEVLRSMNVPLLMMEGYEADDILGTIAKREQSEETEVSIVSGDRDLLQLADRHIKIRIPKTAHGQTTVFDYFPEDVIKEWGVTPSEFIDLKALMGDASDNIPGVPGIGEKTARDIIMQYHSIETAHASAAELKPPRAAKNIVEYWDQAVLSKTLATISLSVPIDFSYEDAAVKDMYNPASLEMIRRLEFKSLSARFSGGSSEKTVPKLDISGCKDVNDPYIAKIAFHDAEAEGSAGFAVTGSGNDAALYFALQGNRLYRFTGFDFRPQLLALRDKVNLYTLSLKGQLPEISFKNGDKAADLSVAAYLVNPLKDSYAYDDIARDFLELSVPSAKELSQPEDAGKYTALIACMAAAPVLKKLQELQETELFRDIEMPLIYTLYEMETEGIRVDRQALLNYGNELKQGIEVLRKKIFSACGEEFNINSPQQLGIILFEKLGLKGGKKTKTGYSTAADVLEKLAEENAVVSDILSYRTLTKLNSTYAEGLLSYISGDGRIHGKFNQMVTATGRISSTDPNLQNIPVRTEMGRRFRKVFVPKEGCTFVDADYSQVELRILASLSGDEKLIEAYRNADDIHAVTASQVFHVPLSEVTPQLRRNAKAVNFGIVYGISAFGLSEGLSISRKEAKEYIERYFETYPDVKKYLDQEVQTAKKNGFIRTLFGRIRPIPEIHSSNFMTRSFGERVAMNSPIQGSAADIMKKAMNDVNHALHEGGFRSRIVLQIHDELLVEADNSEIEAVKQILVDKMQNAADLRVKLVADANTGANWDEAH